MASSPLLRIGTFGTHVVCCNSTFSFLGHTPCGIKQGGYTSEQSAIHAFVQWFKEQDTEWQRAHVADLRNDVFALLLGSNHLDKAGISDHL